MTDETFERQYHEKKETGQVSAVHGTLFNRVMVVCENASCESRNINMTARQVRCTNSVLVNLFI